MGDESDMKLDPEIERELREAAEREEAKLAQEMKDKCQEAFDKRASVMADEFQVSFKNQMTNVGDRYTSHTHDKITDKQTDILRTNKAFRDVSRDLGDDWKPLFQHLMKDQPQDQLKVEYARIERQKPFIQPFKSLNTWKELMGEKFDVRQLVEGLMAIDRKDLAEKVLDILDNNSLDSLYAMEGVGQGIAGGAPKRTKEDAKAEGGAKGQKSKPAPVAEDPIADGKLLKLAKAVGKDWPALAMELGLPEEDIEETKSVAGDSYHGGFKSLFLWRDNCVEAGKNTAECAAELKKVLTNIGKKDLADSVGGS